MQGYCEFCGFSPRCPVCGRDDNAHQHTIHDSHTGSYLPVAVMKHGNKPEKPEPKAVSVQAIVIY